MKTGMILVLATAFACSTAKAATLEDIQGDVRLGRDKGFTRVEGTIEVQPGDKIKVGRKAAARLVYADGCSEPLDANSLSRVAPHSPCSFRADADYVTSQRGLPLPSHKAPLEEPAVVLEEGDPWWLGAIPAALFLAGTGTALGLTGGGPPPVFPILPPPVCTTPCG